MNPSLPSATRFDGIADAYARYRPSYPADAIDAILDGLPNPADVVDLGAGTGTATRLFKNVGARVIGIEPSADMRAAALASGLDVRDATADATGLPDACADLIASFQAFHWFATDAALAEVKRILRRRGRFAAVWNERDPGDDFAMGLRGIDLRHGERTVYTDYNSTEEGIKALLERNGFAARKLDFVNEKRFDEEGIIGRLRSLSFAPREGPELDSFIAETKQLFAKYRDSSGFVALKMITDVYIGERR